MDSIMKEFEHLVVKLEEVKSATDNFNDTKIIGKGGFGNVYEGEVSQPRGKTKAAFKRLDRKHGQGYLEFWKEVMMLSRYTHENLISLLGYCNEGGEMILVYEHASNGSLDRHLSSTTLTWTQRIRICHDAAKGLCYLHEDKGNHHRVLHRDIKSSNILLDENWKAKVSDMGLAKVGPSNMHTFFITTTVGTLGYIDPMYLRMGCLTKESDVYSFGVVLFEVLCGRLCFDHINAHSGNIVHIWKQRYQENKLDEIMFKDNLVQALHQSSLKVFSEIAFQCLQESREKRPKMSDVVEKLEIALKFQEPVDLMIPKEYQEIVKTAVPPLIYRSVEELKVLLSKGVLLNGGKTWLSINEKGEHIERIYIEACLDEIKARYLQDDTVNSRFPGGQCYQYFGGFKARVRGENLTPQISYTANLVFRFNDESYVNSYKKQPLRYKIDGEAKVFIIYPSYMREDGWFIVPLYHFTSQHKTVDLQFQFEDHYTEILLVAGIEFQPSEEKVQLPSFEEYQCIIEASSQSLFYTSLQELKQILSKGVYLNGYKTWLSINEKGEHNERIYIQACLSVSEIEEDYKLQHPSHEIVNSRFPGGGCYEYYREFKARVRGEYLTPHISYTLNLVFRYKYHSPLIEGDRLRYKIDGEAKIFIIYPSYMREDGWFIVPLYHFTSQHKTADLQFEFEYHGVTLLVAGFEFQPSEEKVQLQVFEEYQHIVEAASQSLVYRSLQELKQILSIGIHLKDYKTWFSINEKGEHCHMISMKDCLIPNEDSTPRYKSHPMSRFPAGLYQTNNKGFKTHVKTQLLSPSITYTVNLVYSSSSYGNQVYVDLKYRLRGEATTSVVYLANQRDDYLYMAELYQFTSDGSIVDLEIIFENFSETETNGVEGIMFQPLEIVEDQLLEDDKVEDIETISDSDTYWEQKIPNDYEETLKLSKDSLEWKTKKELYSILCKGFLLDNGQEWFSVDKNGKKCQMISARATVIDDNNSIWESSNESRFGEVLVITASHKFEIKGEIKSKVVSPETNYASYEFRIKGEINSLKLSPKTNYASYLVYKLPQDQSTFEAPLCVWESHDSRLSFIYLVSPPHTPVIGPMFDENTHNPLNRYKASYFPQQRTDGWMEVKVWDFQTTTKSVPMFRIWHSDKKDLSGLMVQGIELRPK